MASRVDNSWLHCLVYLPKLHDTFTKPYILDTLNIVAPKYEWVNTETRQHSTIRIGRILCITPETLT